MYSFVPRAMSFGSIHSFQRVAGPTSLVGLTLHANRMLPTQSYSSTSVTGKTPKEIELEAKLHRKYAEKVLLEQNTTVLPFHASEMALPTPPDQPEIGKDVIAQVASVSGVDKFSKGRKVTILRPPRHAMQSGENNTRRWELIFHPKARWENPLMGWTSSGDSVGNMRLKFDTKEAAILFAEKQGWPFDVEEPVENENLDGKKAYSHNFLPVHIENLLKKEGTRGKRQFAHAKGRQTTFVKTLKYHGEGTVAQHGGESSDKTH